ncbi:MAG: hypothetical protein GXP55_10525 [Deltaproteobacteria bacterium]|nr:hypothetical protein [Deltaproteobacteria bacterium]
MTEFDPVLISATLERHGVRFIVIGGIAASIQGAGWPTEDLDIVVHPSRSNLECLATALNVLDARYEGFYRAPIRPTLERLMDLSGPQLLRTRAGRLDVMKEVAGMTFDQLTQDSTKASVGGVPVHTASISALIRLKEFAGRKKDEAGLRELRAALNRGNRTVTETAWKSDDVDLSDRVDEILYGADHE